MVCTFGATGSAALAGGGGSMRDRGVLAAPRPQLEGHGRRPLPERHLLRETDRLGGDIQACGRAGALDDARFEQAHRWRTRRLVRPLLALTVAVPATLDWIGSDRSRAGHLERMMNDGLVGPVRCDRARRRRRAPSPTRDAGNSTRAAGVHHVPAALRRSVRFTGLDRTVSRRARPSARPPSRGRCRTRWSGGSRPPRSRAERSCSRR
jgi:hypothetical protein